ncbi:MAG: ABC transporter ATP-binding protein [Acidimicrobiia bacterium]|nr:ABC transporter ATP-binding protein [Acidimicrobiia bacterium]
MLSVRGLELVLGSTAVLRGVDLDVGETETVAVIGPSGCGKTSLLRAIAGLEAPAAGTICWDGVDLAGTEAHLRGVGFVFQDYALFPHRDVEANVAFGLRMRRTARAEIDARVARALAAVGLEDMGARRVDQLSGGEQQRVALARALVVEPRMLLLDEPLGALDRNLKSAVLHELGGLLHGRTSLFVTHDREEAFAIADRVAVMRDGVVVQSGEPEAVWRHPADEWVARFCGLDTVVDAFARSGAVVLPWGTSVPCPGGDGPVRVVVHPGTFKLTGAAGADVRATVTTRRFAGSVVSLTLRVGGLDVTVDVDPLTTVRPGEDVGLHVDAAGLTVLGRRADPAPAPAPAPAYQPGPSDASRPSGAGPAAAAIPTGSGATGSPDASRAR